MATLSSRLTPLTVSVPAVSQWLTLSGVTVSGFGTSPTVNGVYQQTGEMASIKITVKVTNTSGAGSFNIVLPVSTTIALSKIPDQNGSLGGTATWVGLANWTDTAVGTTYVGRVFCGSDGRTLNVYGGKVQSCWSSTVPAAILTSTSVNIELNVPISGWSTHTASATSANAVVVGGQSVGSALILGTTNSQALQLRTNNVLRINIGATTSGIELLGRTDGAGVTSGYVGEVLTATATGVVLATGTWKSVCSITLTTGQWLISGFCSIEAVTSGRVGATGEKCFVGIVTTVDSGTGMVYGDNQGRATTFKALFESSCVTIPPRYVTTAATYYLNVNCECTNTGSGTTGPQAYGRITAIRIA